MTVGGDVSVAGDMTIGGDCYTTAYTSFAPAPTNLGASLCSGMYRTLGGWCHVDLYMHGVASANANVTITLPRTAASNIMANNGYMGQMLKDGAMAGPGHMVIVPDTLGAIVYPDAYVTTSFVSSSSYSMWFSVDYPVR